MHVRLCRALDCVISGTLLLTTQSCSCSFHTGLASTSATVSLPWKLPGSSSATYSASDSFPSLSVSEYSKSCFVRRLVAFNPASRRLHQPSWPVTRSRACPTGFRCSGRMPDTWRLAFAMMSAARARHYDPTQG